MKRTHAALLLVSGLAIVGYVVRTTDCPRHPPAPATTEQAPTPVSIQAPSLGAVRHAPSLDMAAPAGGKWFADHLIDEMDASLTGIATLDAEEATLTPSGYQKPSLIFRCRKHKLEAFVDVRSPLAIRYGEDDQAIRFRIDQNQPITQRWTESEDRQAVFVKQPRDLLNKLMKARQLMLEYSTITATNHIARFDVRGLPAHAKALEACGAVSK